jgi:hypothetical protein
MQMKRRQFLGFLGGAAVAGPKAAQAVAKETLTKGSLIGEAVSGGAVPGYYGEPQAASSSGDWKVSRIKELKAILAGKDPEAERREKQQRYYALENRDRARIDSLRSVSFVNKMRLYTEGSFERNERIRRENMRWELADLLKR